jgi:hypothetical protein
MEVFNNYLIETHRILKPGGIAVLYFGRNHTFSLNSSSRVRYLLDRFAESIFLPKGFQELPARVNCINLIVSLPHAKYLARKAGYKVLSQLVSHKKVPDDINYGGQNGLVIKRN